MAIRFVSPMVHVHMHPFTPAKKPFFPITVPGPVSSHQGNNSSISSLQRNIRPGDGKGVQVQERIVQDSDTYKVCGKFRMSHPNKCGKLCTTLKHENSHAN
mmetsp:Transcript_120065/g.208998  ORF Transcript_120065/g.208998 Transcript_120065/m.208998 type:complete len:101 (-) Transcript_120065:1001-1303(-)